MPEDAPETIMDLLGIDIASHVTHKTQPPILQLAIIG